MRPHSLRAWRRAALLASVAAALPATALAQDFRRVIPRPPPAAPAPPVQPPPETQAASQDQQVLVPRLTGVVFVASPEAVRAQGAPAEGLTGGVDVSSLPLLQDVAFQRAVGAYVGQPLTRAGLDQITQQVRDIYRRNGRPFIYVSVPEQSIQNGVVQVLVTEYRLGAVTVTGNRYFSTDRILSMSDLRRGEPITLLRMREAVDDYNQNPFLTVSAVVQPGAETGVSDIALQAKDRRPIRVYAGYDNQGVPTLDRDEWYVGFNWGNVFGTGQIFSYQYTRSFNGDYESHSASDVVPLGANDRLLVFGAYATQTPFIADFFDNTGHSGQASARWVHNLPRSDWLLQTVQIGVDYKRADNNLEFSGFRLLDTAVEVFQIPLIYTATILDRYGETVFENYLVYSPGGVTAHNHTSDLQQLVPGADATYLYDRASVTRTFNLPARTTLVGRALIQVSSDNLPYSEQVAGGGIGSVRGYDTNTALGSDGALASLELRSPAFSLLRKLAPDARVNDEMQLGVFADYAYLRQHTPIPDQPTSTDLASVGVNARYNIDRYFTIQVDVGHQLRKPRFQREHETRAAVIATVAF